MIIIGDFDGKFEICRRFSWSSLVFNCYFGLTLLLRKIKHTSLWNHWGEPFVLFPFMLENKLGLFLVALKVWGIRTIGERNAAAESF